MPTRPLMRSVAAAIISLAAAGSAHAALFNFSFDGTVDASVTPPLVGTGTLSFSGGFTADTTVALSTLSALDMSFTFGSNTFTQADLTTPLANILIKFTTVGSDVLVSFAGSGGPYGGSMDFGSGVSGLSFQPNFGSLYFSPSSFGTYRAVLAAAAVPEPASVALVGAALAALAVGRRRRT